MAEWLKAPHSKCGIGATLSGVQIPLSPPLYSCIFFGKIVPSTFPPLIFLKNRRFYLFKVHPNSRNAKTLQQFGGELL